MSSPRTWLHHPIQRLLEIYRPWVSFEGRLQPPFTGDGLRWQNSSTVARNSLLNFYPLTCKIGLLYVVYETEGKQPLATFNVGDWEVRHMSHWQQRLPEISNDASCRFGASILVFLPLSRLFSFLQYHNLRSNFLPNTNCCPSRYKIFSSRIYSKGL